MTRRYCCEHCLLRQADQPKCRDCDQDTIVDLKELKGEGRSEFIDHLRRRAAGRRRKFILVMEALAILVCAGVLFVGMTVAAGLGGGLVTWGAKAFAVALLAACWVAIPRIYDGNLRGRAADLLTELAEEEAVEAG